MKRFVFCLIFLLCVKYSATLYADEYRWDLINALSRDDFQKIESILKDKINSMSTTDKRLVMNFTINYSYGESTARVINLLTVYNIYPGSFDLYTAINRNQPDNVIQLIVSNGAKANGEILLLAMEKKRFDIAKQFIEAGVDVNYQYPLSKSYADGMTPLLYASKWNNFELVKLLVEHGARINVRAKDGNTALSIARTNGNTQINNYLWEHGADDTRNNFSPPAASTGAAGIAGILNSQAANFQPGTYRLWGGSTDIKLSGNSGFGSISYLKDGTANTGSYRIEGGNITIMMEGYTLLYKIDSNTSFSGNGEMWVRTGN